MKKGLIYIFGFLVLCCVVLVGCGKSTAPKEHPKLNGIYEIDQQYRDKDDQGRVQSNYARFSKNGKVEMAEPETGDDDNGNFGTAYRGTWKHVSGNKFKVHIKSVYDSDEFTITFIKDGKNKIRSLKNHKEAFDWDANSWTRNTSMTNSDFESLFDKANASCQEKVKENGRDDPDNDTTKNSQDSSNGTNVSEEQIAVMLYHLCYPDDDMSKESMEIFSNDGNQFIGNGGPVTIVKYSVDGDTVTYAKKSDGDYGDDQTISVKNLVKQCYNSSDQKSLVDSVASSISDD